MDVLQAFFDEAKRLQLLACASWRGGNGTKGVAGEVELAPAEYDALLHELREAGLVEPVAQGAGAELRLTEKGREAVRGMVRRPRSGRAG